MHVSSLQTCTAHRVALLDRFWEADDLIQGGAVAMPGVEFFSQGGSHLSELILQSVGGLTSGAIGFDPEAQRRARTSMAIPQN
jgi:hypothetical protein